ncbi:MAG: GNAT family N-acetyltransferase [Christensenellales bacterium]|jgi:predicted acetyltransferase
MSKLNVRLAQEQDLVTIRQIWAISFDDPIPFMDWYFENKYSAENTLVYEEGREIVACMQVLPMDILMRGKAFKTGFVVGVSTRPEFRGQGFAGAMLERSFELMRQRGIAYTNLYPEPKGFYGYYRKFGYEVGSARQRYLMPGQQLRELPKSGLTSVAVGADLDFMPLMQLYEAKMRRFSGSVLRDAASWGLRIGEWKLEQHTALLVHDGEELAAYALYTVNKGVLDAYEIVYRDDAALCCLLNGLGERHSGKVQCSLPVSCPIYSYLQDGRECMYLEPYGMQRIVDVENALGGLLTDGKGQIALAVQDGQSEGNCDVFTLRSEGGKMTAMRGGEPELRLDIAMLGRIVFGMSSACELMELGRIQGSLKAALRLDGLFPKVESRIFEKY